MFKDMLLWVWDGYNEEQLYDGNAGPIEPSWLGRSVFAFLGKITPIKKLDYEDVLNDFDRLLPLYRYVEYTTQSSVSAAFESNFAFRPGCRSKKRSTIAQQAKAQTKRDLRHNALQKQLHDELVKEFDKPSVGTEIAGKNGCRIDAVVRHKKSYSFYEIKIADSARACIREALGQILEYSFWPGAPTVADLIIVGEHALDDAADEYLSILKNRFDLPLSYRKVTLK